jgi:hypothetical protein
MPIQNPSDKNRVKCNHLKNAHCPGHNFPCKNPSGSKLPSLFLEDCRKCIGSEDVDIRVIAFNALHMDVLQNRFNTQLPAIFDTKYEEKENKPKGRKKKKQKS